MAQDSLGVAVGSFNYGSGSSENDPKITEVFGSTVDGPLASLNVGDLVAFSNDTSRYYEVIGLIKNADDIAGIQIDGASTVYLYPSDVICIFYQPYDLIVTRGIIAECNQVSNVKRRERAINC